MCPDNYRQAKVREKWYEEPGSLLAQTLQKKTGKEKTENLIFKLPKNFKEIQKP
jgi:hypothetical protein